MFALLVVFFKFGTHARRHLCFASANAPFLYFDSVGFYANCHGIGQFTLMDNNVTLTAGGDKAVE